MTQIHPSEFADLRVRYHDKKIIYCAGTFDLIHPGHAIFLENCKKYGDILVVSVGSDANVKRNKKPDLPIMNQYMRLKMIDSLKPVNFCFISEHSPVHHPLEFLNIAFSTLRPDVYVINRDVADITYRKEVAMKYKVQLILLDRECAPEFENVSTTKLIEKIKQLPRQPPD